MHPLALTLVIVLAIGMFPGLSFSQEGDPGQVWPDAPSIFVQIDAKTWKTRGRLYWDVEGSIRKKLAATGFRVVRLEENPHQVTLKVLYREDRGEQYGINAYGTVMHGTFSLDPVPNNNPWELKISESSTNSISGTPPYLDALDKFQSNPYYFFVGKILRGNLEKGLDKRAGLIYALEVTLARENSTPSPSVSLGQDAGSHLHTMASEKELYETQAIRRAIDDCVDANDHRIIPVLFQLLNHSDAAVRARTIEAMGSFRVEESRTQLLQMAQNDPDLHVRETAKTVKNKLGPVTSAPHVQP